MAREKRIKISCSFFRDLCLSIIVCLRWSQNRWYFYFSRGTIIFYFSYLHFSVSNVSYFSFCSSCLWYLNAYLGDYIDWKQQLEKNLPSCFATPASAQKINSKSGRTPLWTRGILYTCERVQQCKYLTNTIAIDLQGIIVTFCRIYWNLYGTIQKWIQLHRKLIGRSKPMNK